MQVYCDPIIVNSRKVLAGLDQLGLDYQINHVDFMKGQHKTEDFKKINPRAEIPVAIYGNVTLTDPNQILQYAADLSRDDSMYPRDPGQRATVNQWLAWEAASWLPSCRVYLVENMVKPLVWHQQPDQQVLAAESVRFHQCAGVLNTQLASTRWIAGANPTIADIAIATDMHLHAHSKLPLDNYPYLRRWLADVQQLKGWKTTQVAVDKAMSEAGQQ